MQKVVAYFAARSDGLIASIAACGVLAIAWSIVAVFFPRLNVPGIFFWALGLGILVGLIMGRRWSRRSENHAIFQGWQRLTLIVLGIFFSVGTALADNVKTWVARIQASSQASLPDPRTADEQTKKKSWEKVALPSQNIMDLADEVKADADGVQATQYKDFLDNLGMFNKTVQDAIDKHGEPFKVLPQTVADIQQVKDMTDGFKDVPADLDKYRNDADDWRTKAKAIQDNGFQDEQKALQDVATLTQANQILATDQANIRRLGDSLDGNNHFLKERIEAYKAALAKPKAATPPIVPKSTVPATTRPSTGTNVNTPGEMPGAARGKNFKEWLGSVFGIGGDTRWVTVVEGSSTDKTSGKVPPPTKDEISAAIKNVPSDKIGNEMARWEEECRWAVLEKKWTQAEYDAFVDVLAKELGQITSQEPQPAVVASVVAAIAGGGKPLPPQFLLPPNGLFASQAEKDAVQRAILNQSLQKKDQSIYQDCWINGYAKSRLVNQATP